VGRQIEIPRAADCRIIWQHRANIVFLFKLRTYFCHKNVLFSFPASFTQHIRRLESIPAYKQQLTNLSNYKEIVTEARLVMRHSAIYSKPKYHLGVTQRVHRTNIPHAAIMAGSPGFHGTFLSRQWFNYSRSSL